MQLVIDNGVLTTYAYRGIVMDFFDCLRLVLGVLLIINHFIYTLFEPKSDEKKSIDKSKNQEQTSKMDIPLLVINIGSLLVIMGVCLFALMTQKPSWLFLRPAYNTLRLYLHHVPSILAGSWQ